MFQACVGAPGTEIENFSDLRNQKSWKGELCLPRNYGTRDDAPVALARQELGALARVDLPLRPR